MKMVRSYVNPQADAQYRAMLEHPADIPFSFTYGDRTYRGFADEALVLQQSHTTQNGTVTTTELTYLLQEELTVCLRLTHYASHGATEWTVWFQNRTDRDSKVLRDAKSVVTFEGEHPVLSGIYGDHDKDYAPYRFDLADGDVRFCSDSGRATHVYFPYFCLEYGSGGVMLAIGWAGTWSAEFHAEGSRTVYTANSVNHLATCLKPGETIRTALFVCAPYTVRDSAYACNYWRSWFMEHNLPKADASGRALEPFSTCNLASDTGLPQSDGSISERSTTWRRSLEKMFAEDVKVDFRWLDAGWYLSPDLGSAEPFVRGHDWWDTVGTWEVDPVKWPGNSLRESTDFARANGMKTLMWFEPERVTFPDDLVAHFGYQREWAIRQEGVAAISNNIGREDCRKWTTDRICKTLRENRIEMYREDNNSDPARLWQYLDQLEGENRRGITECKFIDGHYQMWDDIIACTLSYGGCGFVDSCASGGGRNDLESLRRGVPILRSDADRTTTALRLSMTTSFLPWIPFCGANTKEKKEQLVATGISDPYVWRASYLPALNVDSQFVQDPDQDFQILRNGLTEWKSIRRYLLKEFYPLTSWHSQTDRSGFTAFLFFDPADETGVLLAFRQEDCADATLSLHLPFDRTCHLTDADSGETLTDSGDGLTLTFEQPRTARLLRLTLKEGVDD